MTNSPKSTLIKAVGVLNGMSYKGALIDIPYFEELQIHYKSLADLHEAELCRLAAKKVNPRAPLQLAKLMYEDLGMKMVNGTSTDAKTIDMLYDKYPDNPVLTTILDYRRVAKLLGTYVSPMLSDNVNGYIHALFDLKGTVTGRLSSKEPNLQNIPKRNGTEIRRGFIAPPGYKCFDIDFSQLEVIVAALLSNDTVLIQLINEGTDVHRFVASKYYGIPPEAVTKHQRTLAKTATFGILYGMDKREAAYNLGISYEAASELIDFVREFFPALSNWATTTIENAKANGYCETLFGRRRHFPLITSANKKDIERQMVNTPVQGTASDICLLGLIKAHEMDYVIEDLLSPRITVHDSIFGYVKDGHENLVAELATILTNPPFESPVKFNVDYGIGSNWGELSE